MCRLFGYRGKVPTKLSFFLVDSSNSLAKQSVLDSRNICNNQGWGVGFYQYGKAFIQKRASCAYFDFNYKMLTDYVETDTMIAHVRDATVGDISDHNAHPFMYDNWICAHNGTIAGFEILKPTIYSWITPELIHEIKGTTDSETLFYLYLSNLQKKNVDLNSKNISKDLIVDTLLETFKNLITLAKENNIEEPHKLNIVITNGVYMLGSCFGNSLCFAERKIPLKHHIKLFKDHVNLHLKIECPADNESVIIASERLDTEDKWIDLKDGTILFVDKNRDVSFFEL